MVMHPAAGFVYKDVYRQVEETMDPLPLAAGTDQS